VDSVEKLPPSKRRSVRFTGAWATSLTHSGSRLSCKGRHPFHQTVTHCVTVFHRRIDIDKGQYMCIMYEEYVRKWMVPFALSLLFHFSKGA